ncbi:MAG: hypothetical protein CNIPEHKO_00887 [Anaerolineales bacterium]|nr:hypothetical protein [Anaerolineales bacterium]
MARSELRLIKNALEYKSIDQIDTVPDRTRGIYALYKCVRKGKNFDLVYVGMARGAKTGIKGRLRSHRKQKNGLWTHFSVFEVWDNIVEEEVEELEGLFRHLFKFDRKANRLNKQKGYKKLRGIRKRTEKEWRSE